MAELRITLVQDRPGKPFYPGSSVTGRLLVNTDKPENYEYISIHFVGEAYVSWEESNCVDGITGYYTSRKVYVDVKQTPWTASQSPDGYLPAGQHSFPFRFDIPRNAPSSFEGTVGSIRYLIHGETKKGRMTESLLYSVLVRQIVDVSTPRLRQPVRREVQNTVCCLCCAPAPIVLTVTVPKTGVYIGETLPIHATIENGSSRRIILKASLDQSVVYTAVGEHKTSKKTVACFRSDELPPHATRDWDPALQIPATEVIDEKSCPNIKMSYSLNFVAIIPWRRNFSTKIPLKLGYTRDQPPP